MVEVPAPEHLDLVDPMLAQSVNPDYLNSIEFDSMWIVGKKYDGFRCFYYIHEDRNWIITRGNKDVSDKLPQLRDAPLSSLAGTVIDFEGVAPSEYLGDTKSILGSSPERAIKWQETHGPLMMVCLDLPRIVGRNVYDFSWMNRREELWNMMELFRKLGMNTKCEEVVSSKKRAFYDSIIVRGGEGVVIKNIHSPYEPGRRSKSWLKVKKVETTDYVILGFEPVGGKGVVRDRVGHEDTVGALIIGAFDDMGELVRMGTCGGLEDAERLMFAARPNDFVNRVVEITGQEIGKGGAMRHPRFIRMREDKEPYECLVSDIVAQSKYSKVTS